MAVLLGIVAGAVPTAWAVGDAGTRFQIFVPPNNDRVNRDSAMIVTNVSPRPSVVQIEDTDEDGDADDSYTDQTLTTGQSLVVYLKDGGVDDDAKGKQDGDYFRIAATEPVVVQLATRSDWQWDFAPADNRSMRGQSFFIYAAGTSNSDRDINVFAYEPETRVTLYRISTEARDRTGLTAVDLESAEEVLNATLQEGEDLDVRHGLGGDILDPGHSYWLRASQPVTVLYGALNKNARDGMAFVPSRNGSSAGDDFYFTIPADYTGERELRLIAYEDETTAVFSGWNGASRTWETIRNFRLNSFGRGDWIESNEGYQLFRLRSVPEKPVSVLIQDWMETNGLSGTKDGMSFGSARSGYGVGKTFLMYLPPPGHQKSVAGYGSTESHVYIYGHIDGTEFRVRDADSNGSLLDESGTIRKGEYARVSVGESLYAKMNQPGENRRPYVRVEADHLVTVQVSNFNDNWMTYVPSVTLPNPSLAVAAASEHVPMGGTEKLLFSMNNIGASELAEGNLRVFLDSGASFLDADFGEYPLGMPQIAVDKESGNQILEWSNFEIAEGETVEAAVQYTVNARRRNESKLRNGDLLLHTVQVRGRGYGVPQAEGGEYELFTAQSSVSVTVQDTRLTLVDGFSAQQQDKEIAVRWRTQTEPDVVLFKVFRSMKIDGPFVPVAHGERAPKGDAMAGADYEVIDKSVSGKQTYFYRLELTDDEGQTRQVGPIRASFEDRIPPEPPTLVSADGFLDRVELLLADAKPADDLKGYEIFRADAPNGAYAKVLGASVLLSRSDTTISNGMTHYYKARAVDEQGNVSLFSNIVSATPPATVEANWLVAYEDMLGPSANDWDYNDFVVRLECEETFSRGGVARVAVGLEPVARGAHFSNALRLRVRGNGAWSAKVQVFENRDSSVLVSESVTSGTNHADVLVWEETRQALRPPSAELPYTNTEAAQLDAILGQFAMVTIDFSDPSANPSNQRHSAPFDPYLKNNLGEIHLTREDSPQSREVVRFYPHSPLYGHHLDYALAIPADGWYWPLGGHRIWGAYPGGFARWVLSGGNEAANWHEAANRDASHTWDRYPFAMAPQSGRSTVSRASHFAASAFAQLSETIAADLGVSSIIAGDYADRVVCATANASYEITDGGTADRFPFSSPRMRPVLLANSEGPVRVLVGSEEYDGDSRVNLYDRHSGAVIWETTVQGTIKSIPAIIEDRYAAVTTDRGILANIDLATGAIRGVLDLGDQQILPKNLLSISSPFAADVDGDGAIEIIAASTSGQVHCVDAETLREEAGWPVALPSPVTADPMVLRHPSSGGAVIIVATHDGTLQGLDAAGQTAGGFPLALGRTILSSPARISSWQGTDFAFFATANGVVTKIDGTGDVAAGWPVFLGKAVSASLTAGDLTGDAEQELVVLAEDGAVIALRADGSAVEEWHHNLGEAAAAAPVISDLDLDAQAELYAATAGGNVLRYEGQNPSALSPGALAHWPMRGMRGFGLVDEQGRYAPTPGAQPQESRVEEWIIF